MNEVMIKSKNLSSWQRVFIAMFVIFYCFWPTDFILDVIPFIGQLDDILVIIIGLTKIIKR